MPDTHQVATKRLTRHEIQEPDQFLSTMDHAIRYIRGHGRRVVTLLVAGVVGAIAVAAGVHWWSSREGRANLALGRLLEIEARPVRGATKPEPAAPAREPFPDAASKDNALLQEADVVLGEHGSSRAARGARLVKAKALLRRGRAGEAMPLLAEVAGKNPSDAVAVAAAFAQATARASTGETDAAVSQLTLLASSGSPFVPKDLALKLAAEISARAGQADSAAKLYQRIADETPQSPFAAEAKSKAHELGGGSGSSGTAAPVTAP